MPARSQRRKRGLLHTNSVSLIQAARAAAALSGDLNSCLGPSFKIRPPSPVRSTAPPVATCAGSNRLFSTRQAARQRFGKGKSEQGLALPPHPHRLHRYNSPFLSPSLHTHREGGSETGMRITWYLPHELRQPVPPDWASAVRHPKGYPTENPSPTRKGLLLRRLADLDKGATKTTRRGGFGRSSASRYPSRASSHCCCIARPYDLAR